jgi:hypothetical protein
MSKVLTTREAVDLFIAELKKTVQGSLHANPETPNSSDRETVAS